MPHLWEMETLWFTKGPHEFVESTFPYKSWKDFMDCKPYKLWKPYILSSWCWKTIHRNEHSTLKRFEPDKTVMECTKWLRVNPSPYDTPISFQDTSENPELDMLQIVFLSPDRFSDVYRVEIIIQRENEEAIKDWLKKHMPSLWKLE
jgi:hypothetical protein